MIDYIVSPVSGEKLEFRINRLCAENGEEYKIVKGVPVLLPQDSKAEWHRELIEVLLWEYPEEIKKMYSEINWKESPVPIYIKYINKYLKDKNGIISALERYSDTNTEKWIAETNDKTITLSQKRKFTKYARKSNGKSRTQTKINATGIFEPYPYFAKAVTKNNPEVIVELGTGAGGATAAVALEMKQSCKLFTVDIGFDCLGNAIGIAKYQKKQIIPVCANFWYLPFADESADAVCTYNGLDESRENEKTLSEISRILKKGGTFTVISRKDAFMRQAAVLEPFGFTKEETVELLKKCRLYGDVQSLSELCEKNGLIVKDQKEFTRNENLTFVLSEFKKI